MMSATLRERGSGPMTRNHCDETRQMLRSWRQHEQIRRRHCLTNYGTSSSRSRCHQKLGPGLQGGRRARAFGSAKTSAASSPSAVTVLIRRAQHRSPLGTYCHPKNPSAGGGRWAGGSGDSIKGPRPPKR